MDSAHRVLWGEGMFLRPQHFQQHAIYQEWLLSQFATQTASHPYGLKRAGLDIASLTTGTLRLNYANGTMHDGTLINIPTSDPPPPTRNLNEIPNVGVETIVYLCLPALNTYGSNCADPEQKTSQPVRYSISSVSTPDLFTSGIEAEFNVLKHRTVLLTGNENRDGYYSLPIAQITLTPSGVWALDEHYIPPMLNIHGNDTLVALVRRLLDMLFVKSQALTARHRERAKNLTEHSTSDISSFWLLHTVNRNFPKLSHLLSAPLIHPEQLYLALAELNGELMTFSSTASLREIPSYEHNNLSNTFSLLEKSIRSLLDTVISSRYQVIPLSSLRPSLYVGRLESDNLLENVDFYLSVESQQPASLIIETVPFKFKVGSPEDVEKILNSALPGVALSHAHQTPAAIPVRIGNVYFALEPGSMIYDRMKASRSICIYIPHTLQDIKVELIAVFR